MNPFDVIGNVLGAIFGWIANSWGNAGTAAMKDAMTALSKASWPDFSQQWFHDLWNSVFGLSVLIAVCALIFHSIIFMFRGSHETLGETIANFFRMLLNGLFLVLVVVFCTTVVDLLIKGIIALTTTLLKATAWTSVLTWTTDSSPMSIWLALPLRFAGVSLGNTLLVEATLYSWALVFMMVWYLFGSSLGFGRIGQFLRSMLMGAVLTLLFARVLQMFTLGVAAVIMNTAHSLGMSGLVSVIGILGTMLCTTGIPAIMWILFTFLSYRQERRLDVRAFMRRQSQNTTRSVSSKQLAESQASNEAQVQKESALSTTSKVARSAAVIAASAALAKTAGAVMSKLPTPQTKLGAAGLYALGLLLQQFSNKSKSYVHDKMSQPGSTRAKSRVR